MKTMRSPRIDFEFGLLPGRLQRSFHRFDLCDSNALVGFAIKTEDRCFHVRREFGSTLGPDGFLRRGINYWAIERDTGFDVAVVGTIDPHRASTAAEANDAQSPDISALCFCPINRGIEVGNQLCIWL